VAKFTDTISIHVRAGAGGPGAVSFHREKFIPRGGPDGGDGGRGGNVYFEADYNYHTLSHLFRDRVYRAGSGTGGMGQNRHGRDGDDLVIKVPPGTSVMDEDGESLADLVESGSRFMACEGGIGGHGNAFFKTSTHQTPRFAQPGMPGEEKYLTLNLRLIADVGLVGLPNAGKSTLLARLTNAKPKIAGYPFTTLIPNLGVVERPGGKTYKIADIPGIIEGAHRGLGLGLSFLQHIERVKCILFLIDVSEDNLHYTLELLRAELGQYNEKLLERPCCVLLTKTDLVLEEETDEKAAAFGNERVLAVSAHEGSGVERLYEIIDELLETGGAPQTDS